MVDLEFTQSLPADVPRELPIYATAAPRVNQAGLRELARRWMPEQAATHSPEFTRFEGWTVLRHGPAIVAQNRRSGAIRVQDDGRYGHPRYESFELSETRLAEIAREFVDRMQLLDTPAKELALGGIVYSHLQAMSTGGERTPDYILDAGVVLTRTIEGVPVAGPGGHLMTHILSDGTVVACVKVWREIAESVGAARVNLPEWGLAEFSQRLQKRGLAGKVKVLKAQFGYFEAGTVDRQRYLEPTYAFVFETVMAGGLYKSVEIIPAVEHPKQKWRHARHRSEPEVLRSRRG